MAAKKSVGKGAAKRTGKTAGPYRGARSSPHEQRPPRRTLERDPEREAKNRARYVESGSEDAKKNAERLQRQIGGVQKDFSDWARKAHSNRINYPQVDKMTSLYNQRLLMVCAQNLMRGGLSIQSVLSTGAMYAGMALVSPSFRSQVGTTVRNLFYGPMKELAEEHPNSKFTKWRDKLFESQYHRQPMTPESAAITQIGFMKSAYEKMREPGADVEKISKDYSEAIKELHSMARQDGISSADLNQAVRTVAGQIVSAYPDEKLFFAEMCPDMKSDGCVRSDFHPVDEPDGTVSQVWTGEYTKDGEAFTGAFTPRQPMNGEMYERVGRAAVTKLAEGCETPGDLWGKLRSDEWAKKVEMFSQMSEADGLDPKKFLYLGFERGFTERCLEYSTAGKMTMDEYTAYDEAFKEDLFGGGRGDFSEYQDEREARWAREHPEDAAEGLHPAPEFMDDPDYRHMPLDMIDQMMAEEEEYERRQSGMGRTFEAEDGVSGISSEEEADMFAEQMLDDESLFAVDEDVAEELMDDIGDDLDM